jgi:hypothetical protein
MQNLIVEVIYSNTMFDFKVFGSPVINYFEEPLTLSLSNNTLQYTEFFVNQAESELYEQYVSYWQKDSDNFL